MMSSSTLSLDRYAYGAPALLCLLKPRVLQSPATDPVPSLEEEGIQGVGFGGGHAQADISCRIQTMVRLIVSDRIK